MECDSKDLLGFLIETVSIPTINLRHFSNQWKAAVPTVHMVLYIQTQ